MRRSNISKVGTKSVKKEMIALGRLLARCGQVNASDKPINTSDEDGETNKNNLQIVCADVCASEVECDVEYKKYLASSRESHPHPYMLDGDNTSPRRIMYNVDNEPTDGREVNVEKSRSKRRSKSPLLISDVSKRLKTENGKEDQKSNSIPVFRKEVVLRGRKIALTKNTVKSEPISDDDKDIQQEKEVARRGRKSALTKNTVKLEPTSNDVKDTIQEKEVARRGRKSALTKNTVKLEPSTSNDVKETQQKKEVGRRGRKPKNNFKACKLENEESSAMRKATPQTILRASKRLQAEKIVPVVNTKESQRKKEDARQGKKSSVTKTSFKTYKKENEESSAMRNEKSQTIFRASKRQKTENGRADHNSMSKTFPVVNTKDIKRKKGEAVTKTNVKSKPTIYVKDNLLHSFKAHKKETEESRSLVDKSYEYFLAYLRNSITVVEPDPNVKPEKDLVPLSDPDIIAVSDYPFSDGGISPFEANKDGKVIDLEDRIEPDNIFNSSFSKKLLETLRKPYDKIEFLQRCHEASHKRQVTRSRQLRDGREIEYNVDDQVGRSYLDQYPDFKRLFRRCRYGKDDLRALNLLRGFFFYFENIVLEGAFKPWLYETRLKRECKDIVCIK